MAVSQPRTYSLRSNEGGFTLPEVLIVIVLMGIVFAIATSSWNGMVESRQVDSATNQLVADLRLAHTQATNRLTSYQIVVPNNNSLTYQFGPSGGTLETRTLPDGTQIAAATTVTFRASGTADVPGSITVASDDGNPSHVITINSATSKVKID